VAANGRILGVGPDLGVRAYRVFDAEGFGYTDWFVSGMIAAADDHVDVVSMSLATYDGIAGYTWTDPETGTVYTLKDLADFLAWKKAPRYVVNAGVVLVVAAANEATNISNPKATTAMLNEVYGPLGYHVWGASRVVPATVPGAVTVSATAPDRSPTSYTNFGPGAIDLSAPGGEPSGYSDLTPSPRYWDPYYYDLCLGADLEAWGSYNWWYGTSMATPKVAAVAALVIDQAKAEGRRLTPAQVVARLQQTAIDLGKPGYDRYYGYGMVNAASALARV
jgi:lantibiotic leader peptide-processing serine protease